MSRARPFCEKHPDADSDSCMVCVACDDERRAAIEQRDDLLAACEAALAHVTPHATGTYEQLRAAIAAAKGTR